MLTPRGEIPDRLAAGMSMAEQHDWLAVRADRRTVLRGLLVAGASMSPLLWKQSARAAAADVRVAGRLLVPGGNPAREMTVSVAVRGSFRAGRLEAVATSGGGGASGALETQVVPGSSMRYARATLTGLEPDTDYTYRVRLDDVGASSGTFRTAPDGAIGFRFTAFGDQGTGAPSRSMVRRLTALQPDLHLVAGDICYANQDGDGGPGDFHPALWDAWLAENDAVAGSVPYLCTLGNHEMEPGFATHGYAGVLARIPLPGHSPLRCPASWAVRYGTVGFVGLDSNDVSYELPRNRGYTGGAQRAWLDQTLAAFRAPGSGVEFVVAMLHHSPYSTNEAHASEGGVRDSWVPLFDKYGVDLVIAGHNHCYERTLPLRGGRVVGTDQALIDSTSGTTYVTAGGGGANISTKFIKEGRSRLSTASGPEPETSDWSLPGRAGTHGVLVGEVHPGGRPGVDSRLSLRAVDSDGQVLDTFELSRPATVAAAATSAGGGGLSTRAIALVGAAGSVAVVGAAAGAGALRSRRDRPTRPEPVDPPPSKVVVRPLLESGVESQTVVLRRPADPSARTLPADAADSPPARPAEAVDARPGGPTVERVRKRGSGPGAGWATDPGVDDVTAANRAADRAARPPLPRRPPPVGEPGRPTPPSAAEPPADPPLPLHRPLPRRLTEGPPPKPSDIDPATMMITLPATALGSHDAPASVERPLGRPAGEAEVDGEHVDGAGTDGVDPAPEAAGQAGGQTDGPAAGGLPGEGSRSGSDRHDSAKDVRAEADVDAATVPLRLPPRRSEPEPRTHGLHPDGARWFDRPADPTDG